MREYKIALIVEEIGQSYQSSILNGISAAAHDFGLNIFAFTSFSGDMNNPRHDMGEFNIFNLPDFSDFDGAILLTNTLSHQPVVNDIITRIKIAGIPAVSIDNDLPFFYHIGIDNKTAMRQITEHMINVHGFSKFAYISGPDDNPESVDRFNSFCKVLHEHGLEINNDAVYYGDFRSPSGKAAAEHFLKNLPEMPQAIICANDVMASAAITRLVEAGYRVPEDIAVTGFDNTYSNHNFRVELTSVERPFGLSGRIACKILYNHFQNIHQERNIILNMSAHFTESCGCGHNAIMDVNELKELNYRNYSKYERHQNYTIILNRMSTQLLACNNFNEYIETLKKATAEIAPDEFYFCLCDNWDSETAIDRSTIMEGAELPVPMTFTDEVNVVIAYANGKFMECGKIKSSDILPPAASEIKGGKLYYITPLHFGDRCLGYMALRSTHIALHNIMFETLCINMSNSLENIRKLMCLEYALARLGKLYAKDTFSGIYNRNGFVNATQGLYNDCIEQQKNIMLMFIDLDGLKVINDTYGHSMGDKAICYIADVLRESCIKNEIFCRFGGDEFIVFAADYSEDDANELTKLIKENITKLNENHEEPFTLGASTGFVVATPQQGEDLFYFVTEADKKMYKEKRKKKSRYLKR